jgi:hypothetical protein
MTVSGCGLQALQDMNHVGQVCGFDQPVVHGEVPDFCIHPHFACLQQIVRDFNLFRSRNSRERDSVLFKQCQQRLDMPLFSLYNVDEWTDGAESVDYFSVSVSGPVFVQQCFMQNFFQRKIIHVGKPALSLFQTYPGTAAAMENSCHPVRKPFQLP